MKTLSEISLNERPREKILKNGPKSLNDKELLAIVLGSGTKNADVLSICSQILSLINGEKKVSSENLMKISGVGLVRAAQVLAAIELSNRFIQRKKKTTVHSAKDVLPALAFLKKELQEHFVLVTLDAAYQIINIHTVTKGLVNRSQVHPRETFLHVIKDGAVGFIIAHNHPSGNLEVSDSDKKVTQRLLEVSKLVGIPLLDHLIISNMGFCSIRETQPEIF